MAAALAARQRRRLRRGDAPRRGHDPHGVREAARRTAAAAAPPWSRCSTARRRRRRPPSSSTPELLPVLKQAGVVDAGGAGFVLLLDAVASMSSTAAPCPTPRSCPPAAATGALVERRAPPAAADRQDVSDLRYEVMYFLEAPDDAVPAFKDVWAGIGDSIVVVGGDGLWNCHIHTDDIGAAIEAAIDFGRPAPSASPTCSSRSRRSAGCATARRRRPRRRPRASCPSRPRWWRSPPATESGASSTRSACTRSWPAASR